MEQNTFHRQSGKLLSVIAEHMPDLYTNEMQFLIQNPQELEKRLYKALVPQQRQEPLKNIAVNEGYLIVDACDGSEILFDAQDVFPGDTDKVSFQNYKLNERAKATKACNVIIYDSPNDIPLTNKQRFRAFSEDLDKVCLTQHQVKVFCEKYKHFLNPLGEVTRFLVRKGKNDYYVVYVYTTDDMCVNVTHLEYDDKHPSIKNVRIVVPF